MKQKKGLPMGSSISPILSMLIIFDLCIRYEIKNLILYIDDFKLLNSDNKKIELLKFLINNELNLNITLSSEEKMLELHYDNEKMTWNYNLDKQRRHINTNKLSSPNNITTFEQVCISDPIDNVIKNYIKKIEFMSDDKLLKHKNYSSLMYRCFQSGYLMNYILSENNRINGFKNPLHTSYIKRKLKKSNKNYSIKYIKGNEEIKKKERDKKINYLIKRLSIRLRRLVVNPK